MTNNSIGAACLVAAAGLVASCTTSRSLPEDGVEPAQEQARRVEAEQEGRAVTAIAPKEFPPVPRAEVAAAWVPEGFRAEAVMRDLTYPTSVEFDDAGNVYVAEAGFSYGDLVAPARIWRIAPDGALDVAAEDLSGPVTDLLWHIDRLLISHRGKVSALQSDGAVIDLVTGLPSHGDHHNNQLTVGADNKIYVGQGTVTNSGIVGLDNIYPFLWLTQHPDLHDISPRPLRLKDVTFTTPDPLTVLARQGEMVTTFSAVRRILSRDEPLLVRTGAFQPFGRHADSVPGTDKANGTILRMDLDGSNLEVFAWGLRNPFGLLWGPDGQLYTSDNGFDERGSRPIANAPDCVFIVREGAWYGFPDFAGGVPVTDARFRPSRGDAPELLLAEHPPCETPLFTRPPHATPTKLEFGRSSFGDTDGKLFMAEFGGGGPVTGSAANPVGHCVVAVDLATRAVTPFFRAQESAAGPAGYEHVATPGPRRPIDVRFAPDGEALYVVDFGALAVFPAGAGPMARPFPGTGVLWRIVAADAPTQSPPADLSPIPGRGRPAAGK